MHATSAGIEISIIVPALNEAANLEPLVRRLAAVLHGRRYEILIIDDGSRDGTTVVCQELAGQYPLQLHHRSEPTGGLSGAVLYGLAKATGDYLVVMDADLQHPPEQVPELLEALTRGLADFAIGSRYVSGGSTQEGWGFLRRANSSVATLLARPFAGRLCDPMSGFFALPRQTYAQGGDFNPIGYKIALELICKCHVRQVREVPIRFGLRVAGESKLTLTQQVRYLDHLSRLSDYCFPRQTSWMKFAVATGLAWFVAFGIYVRLVAHEVNPILAPAIAFAAAAVMSAAIHMRSMRNQSRGGKSWRNWLDFGLLTVGEWSICTLSSHYVAEHLLHLTAIRFFLVIFGVTAVGRWALRMKLLRNLRSVRIPAADAVSQPTASTHRQAA